MKTKVVSLILALCMMATLAMAETSTNDSHYPVTVTTYGPSNGEVVEQVFEEAPERIISVSQANTELLIGLGLADKIVGTAHTTSEPYGPTAEVYKSLNYITDTTDAYPSKEVVLSLEPDIIFGWGSLFAEDDLGAVQYWHEKGIHTYLMKNTVSGLGENRNFGWLVDDIRAIGAIFNIEDKTDALIVEIESKLNAISERTKDIPMEERPTVFTVQMVRENEFFARASTDLSADIVRLAGGNCLDETYGYQSMENLIAKDPDVILVINRTTKPAADTIAALKANSSLQNLKAIKNDNFYVLDHASFYCGSMRTIEDITGLAEKLATFE